jgi:hypothetical protein
MQSEQMGGGTDGRGEQAGSPQARARQPGAKDEEKKNGDVKGGVEKELQGRGKSVGTRSPGRAGNAKRQCAIDRATYSRMH